MRRIVQTMRVATNLMFYWFALKTSVVSLAIAHGWHDHPPKGLPPLSDPWWILIDGALAVVMYILHDKLNNV